ncbi:MAG: tyrosine-protein phosphatase [Streptosporangiaceae bacterium]
MAEHGGSGPGRAITIASVPNFRDIGGYAIVGGGRVRTGVLYRSAALSGLADADLPAFRSLGIRTVFDLRTEDERGTRPDRTPPGMRIVVLDVMADAAGAAPAQLESVLSDPAAAARMLGDGGAAPLFERGYRDIVALPSALRAYRQFFTELADAANRPALVHCTTGKDRTGWAAAVTLMLVGVRDDDVMLDYLRTNRDLLPALQPLLDRFARAGGDPSLLRPVLGVQRAYLDTAITEMRSRFGSIEGYVRDGLGLPADTIAALRAALTEAG